MRSAEELLASWKQGMGRVESLPGDTIEMLESFALYMIRIIQEDAAADMRERAKAYCDETAAMLGPNGGGIAHRMGIDIAELPLAAPSAGVPVDDTGRKERG